MPERFLLDENIPASVIELLTRKGFEARAVTRVLGGASSNGRIAAEAAKSGDIIITLDSDFLKLYPNASNVKLIFIDVHPAIPSLVGQVLETHLRRCIQLLKDVPKVTLTKTGPAPSSG